MQAKIAPSVFIPKPTEDKNNYAPAETLLRHNERFDSVTAGHSTLAAYRHAQSALDAFNANPDAVHFYDLAAQVSEARECAGIYTSKLNAEGGKPDEEVKKSERNFELNLQSAKIVGQLNAVLAPLKNRAEVDVQNAWYQLGAVGRQLNDAPSNGSKHDQLMTDYRTASMANDDARARESKLAQFSHMLLGDQINSRL